MIRDRRKVKNHRPALALIGIACATVLVACGSSKKKTPALSLTGSLDGARAFVADGLTLPLSGTSDGGTLELFVDGEWVADVPVDPGTFFTELNAFGATEGTKALTVRLKGEDAQATASVTKSVVELDVHAANYLNELGTRHEERLARWPDGPIRIVATDPVLTDMAAKVLPRIASWTGLDLALDEAGPIRIELHENPRSYTYEYSVLEQKLQSATLKIGSQIATESMLTRVLLYGLGMPTIAPENVTHNGSVLDKNFVDFVGLYPYQQQAFRILHSYPAGQRAVLPPSRLGIRMAEDPDVPLALVADGTIIGMTLDVRQAERVEVLAQNELVYEWSTPNGGLYPIYLDRFGVPGTKELLFKAVGPAGETTINLAIDHDPTKVMELARGYAEKYVASKDSKTARWAKTTLTVKNHYPAVEQALVDAVAYLNQALVVKFEITAGDDADIHVYEDTNLNGRSIGGYRLNSSLELYDGEVKIEPDHAKTWGIVAHELGHVIGLEHIEDDDTTNRPSMMTPIRSRDVLYPHQQLGINLVYRNPPGTPIASLQ